MKRVAVLTSGGDAPGMNAALRAVVRVGSARDLEIIGVRQGFSGLIDGQLRPLGARDVAGIIHLGGTMLGSARAPEFREPEGRDRALAILNKHRIDGIVVIGGNGSPAPTRCRPRGSRWSASRPRSTTTSTARISRSGWTPP